MSLESPTANNSCNNAKTQIKNALMSNFSHLNKTYSPNKPIKPSSSSSSSSSSSAAASPNTNLSNTSTPNSKYLNHNRTNIDNNHHHHHQNPSRTDDTMLHEIKVVRCCVYFSFSIYFNNRFSVSYIFH